MIDQVAAPPGQTDDGSDQSEVDALQADLDRLRSRLDRERKARRQAEMIAERGMRELWETNRDLQDRVARRTAELERVTNALEYAQIARLRAVHDLVDDLADELGAVGRDGADVRAILDQLRSLTEPSRSLDHAASSGNGAVELADRLVERWQRSAAKRGQLLTVEERDSTVDDVVHWPHMLAVADTLIGAIVRVGGGGSVAVRVTAGDEVASLCLSGSPLDDALVGAHIGDRQAPGSSSVRADVALAARISGTVGGSVEIADIDGFVGVAVTLPQTD